MSKNGPRFPYISWNTFLRFIQHLRTTRVPARIDASVMPRGMSGSDRAGVMTALRFFRFIDENGTVSKSLRDFVSAYGAEDETDKNWEDKWQNAVGEVLHSSPFQQIMENLDLDNATQRQLDEKFEAAGVTGQMRDKCIRFFLSTLEAAKYGFSPHFGRKRDYQTRGRPTGKKKSPRQKREGAIIEPENHDDTGMVSLPLFPFPRRILVPADIGLGECDAVNDLIRAYAKSVSAGKKPAK